MKTISLCKQILLGIISIVVFKMPVKQNTLPPCCRKSTHKFVSPYLVYSRIARLRPVAVDVFLGRVANFGKIISMEHARLRHLRSRKLLTELRLVRILAALRLYLAGKKNGKKKKLYTYVCVRACLSASVCLQLNLTITINKYNIICTFMPKCMINSY